MCIWLAVPVTLNSFGTPHIGYCCNERPRGIPNVWPGFHISDLLLANSSRSHIKDQFVYFTKSVGIKTLSEFVSLIGTIGNIPLFVFKRNSPSTSLKRSWNWFSQMSEMNQCQQKYLEPDWDNQKYDNNIAIVERTLKK